MYEENSIRTGSNSQKERGGLIPITAHILHQAVINSEETIEYNSIPICDIYILGYITSYKNEESQVKIDIWDQTGLVTVLFFNKNENESNSGLGSFRYEGKKTMVKIFGTTKVYKKQKMLQGAKLIPSSHNDLFYHYLEVMNDWLYLTGRLPQMKGESFSSSENSRLMAKGGNENSCQNISTNGQTPLEIAQQFLSNYKRRKGKEIGKGELREELRKLLNTDKIYNVIDELTDQGFIFEEDVKYIITS